MQPLDIGTERLRRTGEALPDAEMHRLVSAVVNHELKALTCIAMQPDTLYARVDFPALLTSIQGPNPIWISDDIGFDYCRSSLAPIGLVAKEYLAEDQTTIGFIKTPYGESIGEAASGHFLDYSLKYPDFSIIELFGSTRTTAASGQRSPTVTAEIIKNLLAAKGPVRTSDLLGTPYGTAVASTHANSLAHAGLITLIKRSNSDPIKSYALAETPLKDLRLLPHQSRLPSDVRDILADYLHAGKKESITIPQIITELIAKHPEYLGLVTHRLNVRVRQALRLFEHKGAIKNISDFTNEAHSIITLTEKQRQALEDCRALLNGLETPSAEFIESGKLKATKILADPAAVKTLVQKAREKSPYVGKRSKDERTNYMLSLLRKHTGVTVAQLEVDTKSTKRLSRASIRRILHELEAEEQAVSRKIDKKVVWFLVEHTAV